MSVQNSMREFGHKECRADIDEFTKRYPYGNRSIGTFQREYKEAFAHMNGDSFTTCGKRECCWECIPYFNEKINTR